MSLSDLPVTDRPRERLLQDGPDALSERELLAVVLGTGVPGRSALSLAEALLARFRDLRRMAGAGLAEMVDVPGVGVVQACRVQAALALASRLCDRPYARGEFLGGPGVVYSRIGRRMALLQNEVFRAIGLDAKGRVILDRQLAEGGVCSVDVAPRDVFSALVREAAVGAVFLHNHPSGDPTPSEADRLLTTRLVNAANLLGLRMVDHVVVGETGWYSFAEDRLVQSPGLARNVCPDPAVG